MLSNDTICAIATAPLVSGVGIVRLSGVQAKSIAEKLCPSFTKSQPRVAHYGSLKDGEGVVFDHALLLYFSAPNSFTGEEVVEIHTHGSLYILEKVMDFLTAQDGVRRAEAGEFTRRAVENNKLDLTQAEGLCDLIAAQTEAQAKQAMKQLDGELGQTFDGWRLDILALLAQVEAAIDFPDEELDILADAALTKKINAFLAHIEQALSSNMGERLREGFTLAIIGRPNAGKSTLTNLLTGKNTAIVSDTAGTTRDVVTAQLTIGGFPVQLADTAGLRADTNDEIEKIGISRATDTAEKADLVIALTSAADWAETGAPSDEIQPLLQAGRTILLVTKTDEMDVDLPSGFDGHSLVGVNLQSGGAQAVVLEKLSELIQKAYAPAAAAGAVTRARHREALENAKKSLSQALGLYQNPETPSLAELLAQDLRDAATAIGTITGNTTSEDVLDAVFSTFCIGK